MPLASLLRRAVAPIAALALVMAAMPTPVAAANEVFIHQVQGSGTSTPMPFASVTIEGVVVGDFQTSARFSGFFVQEEDADADDSASTSEGIFVFDGSTPRTDVALGDLVRVTGTAREFSGLTQVSATSTSSSVTILASDAGSLVTATALSFPMSNAAREAVEGMLVSVSDAYVTDTFNLHRFGEVWLAAGGVVEQPTNELPPGEEMKALAAANIARSVLLDDGRNPSNPRPIPYLHASGTLRVGDRANSLTAVMHFGFGQYRLQPVGEVEFDDVNVREAPDLDADLTVAAFNVLNYWTTIGCGFPCRGAQTAEQLAIQTEKLVAAIRGMDADVVGLEELENDPTHRPITTLVDALNAAEGAVVWAWVGPADHYNTYPIRNEIIYRVGAVTPVGTPDALEHPAFDALGPSGEAFGRPPLAQTFDAQGARFTVVVNHFKSKSSSCGEPNEGADGQGSCNQKRVEQAEAVLDFVAELQAIDLDVLVVGDLNAYMEEDPIRTLETELVNLVAAYDDDPYSYNFFAIASAPFIGRGSLDHALATPSLAAKVSDTMTWHINADEPRFLDWFDPATSGPGPYRSSDHDPVLIGISLDEVE